MSAGRSRGQPPPRPFPDGKGGERPHGTHLVLIPSFNPGAGNLRATVAAAAAAWAPVWVVSDGSDDGSDAAVEPAGGRLIRRAANGGKGAALRTGLEAAAAAGFTHALTLDADDQHPADRIADFMAASLARPEAMVLGRPVFGPDAPAIRVLGRRLSNAATRLLGRGTRIDDALFGFRVYPVAPLLAAVRASPGMRGYDFDAEAVIRLARAGVPAVNLPAPVRYAPRGAGGVSHFRYGRDNLRLAAMFLRLLRR